MGSPTFGFPSSNNNAPLPPFFAGNNPTGGAFNFGGSNSGSFPSIPLFGNPNNTGVVSPLANAPVFSAGNMGSINSGFQPNWPNDPNKGFQKELWKAYGGGLGSYIDNILARGLFNPSVASALLNAMQPGIQRGEGDILSAFGAEGSRFGSAAGLGLGDFMSQATLNEQQVLANLFLQDQQLQMGLLENVMPTLHAEQANKGGFWHDIFGGLSNILGNTFLGGVLNASQGKSGGGSSGGIDPSIISMLTGGNSGSSSPMSGMFNTSTGSLADLNSLTSSEELWNLISSAGPSIGG